MNPLSWQRRIRSWERFTQSIPDKPLPSSYPGIHLSTVTIDCHTGRILKEEPGSGKIIQIEERPPSRP